MAIIGGVIALHELDRTTLDTQCVCDFASKMRLRGRMAPHERSDGRRAALRRPWLASPAALVAER